MYAIIKNDSLVWFTDYTPTDENFVFDELIEWDFDTNKIRKLENWRIVEDCNIENSEQCKNHCIIEKSKKVLEIEKEIRSLWDTKTTSTFLKNVNTQKITKLKAEKLALETELDELTTWIETSALDDIISAIFS